MTSPLVSIVIPALDAEATIAMCLEACFAQTYSRLEIVVVDNGSRDGTVARVRALAERARCPVELLTCEERGPGPARNLGFRATHGELIAWVDADDLIFPEKLARQVPVLQGKPNPAIASSEVLMERSTDGSRPVIDGVFTMPPSDRPRAEAVVGRRGIPPCGYLLNRQAAQLLHDSGGFLPVRCQDREYFARAHLLGAEFEHHPEVLSVYRNWSRQQVTNSLDRLLWAPALARCYESLRAAARAGAVPIEPDVERALAMSWAYYEFCPFEWPSPSEIAWSSPSGRKTRVLDRLERAIVLACGEQQVVLIESLAAYTAKLLPMLGQSYLRLVEAAIALIDARSATGIRNPTVGRGLNFPVFPGNALKVGAPSLTRAVQKPDGILASLRVSPDEVIVAVAVEIRGPADGPLLVGNRWNESAGGDFAVSHEP